MKVLEFRVLEHKKMLEHRVVPIINTLVEMSNIWYLEETSQEIKRE